MRWWPFRRGGGGRHAFGAAVTSIPTGPLVLPVTPVPAAAPLDETDLTALLARFGVTDVDVASEPDVQAAFPPVAQAPSDLDVGRAVVAPVVHPPSDPDVSAPVDPHVHVHLDVEPVLAPASPGRAVEAVVVPAQPAGPPAEADQLPPPVVVVPVQAAPPFVPPDPPVLSPDLLAVALEEPGSRVHLEFRDGSTADLEPGSEQAQALADLARALTTAD